MPDTTPTYGFPFQVGGDPPDGAAVGEELANAVEDELERVESEKFAIADYAAVTDVVAAVADTPTSKAVSYGKTFGTTPIAVACAVSVAPGTVVEVTVNNQTTTGCTVTVYRTTSANVTVNVLAFVPS